MTDKLQLNHPWLVAVWPGMGHVALNAGFYLVMQLSFCKSGLGYEAVEVVGLGR
jgi:hypothetical protein